jgi:N-acylglucosamine 2-epimerase
MDLPTLRNAYASTLLDDVIPFWERHALDPDGGINTCITDDGTVLSRERWCWSQWRAVWVFSKLYNAIAPEGRWLKTARAICRYVRSQGPLAGGHWPLLLDAHGQVKRGYESIFTDTFAIYGLVELWRATQEDDLLTAAMATFRAIEESLAGDELPPIFPYPTPPAPTAMAHGISMMCSLVYRELARATGDQAVRAAAGLHHRRVMDTFVRRDRGLVLEWLDRGGNEYPPPEGTAVLPGHAIESMWFQMEIARDTGDCKTSDRAVEVIRRNLEIGWDREYGGLFYAVDADGGAEVAWPFADTKLWWVHTEALVGTLLAYEHCRQDWCLDWHDRVREYSYAHYPVAEHGEWRQKLDRRGRPITDVVALPVKDPFHLPRALILCVDVLDRLTAR